MHRVQEFDVVRRVVDLIEFRVQFALHGLQCVHKLFQMGLGTHERGGVEDPGDSIEEFRRKHVYTMHPCAAKQPHSLGNDRTRWATSFEIRPSS